MVYFSVLKKDRIWIERREKKSGNLPIAMREGKNKNYINPFCGRD
jgi:hypothetical protein